MADPSPDPSVLREQATTLYTLYQRQAQSFRRTFIGLVALMTVVFMLIFWPLVNFRGELYRFEGRYAALQDSIEAATREAGDLAEEIPYFEAARREVHHFVDDILQDYDRSRRQHDQQLQWAIERLENEAGVAAWLAGDADSPTLSREIVEQYPILEDYRGTPCFWARDEVWDRCWVSQAVTSLGLEAREHYQHRRISHLRNELAAPLLDTLTAVSGSFASWIGGERDGWRFDGQPAARDIPVEFADFARQFARYTSLHFGGVTRAHSNIESRIRGLESEALSVDAAIDLIHARIDEIAALQNIDTPFGRLPVGINDLALLFPILLAAGFLLCVSQFSETLSIRRSFHGIRRAQDPRVFTDEYIALIAPVWADPLRDRIQRVIGITILFTPALVFLVSIALLSSNRLLWGDFMEEVRLGAGVYFVGYAISVALFVVGGRRIAAALAGSPRSGLPGADSPPAGPRAENTRTEEGAGYP